MSGQPKRSMERKNYADLHHGRKRSPLLGDNSKDNSDDQISINSDPDDEFNTTEEGEISDSEDSEAGDLEGSKLDDAIKEAFSNDDFDLAETLLQRKERRCSKLKQELVLEEKNKEIAERKRKKRLMEERFKKLQETEDSLNRSLATSRGSTPVSSPPSSGRKHKKAKTTRSHIKKTSSPIDKRKARRKSSPRKITKKAHKDDTSEYPNLINTITSLSNGKTEAFTELMAKAMQSKDNLECLESQEGEQYFRNSNLKSATVDSKVGQEQLFEILRAIKDNRKSVHKHKVPRYQNNNKVESADDNSDSDTDTELSMQTDNRKLKSGKCAKPDSCDIKKVVKFAHEKLDVKHVKNRTFDSLSFNLLMAGEIELVLLKSTKPDEKEARLNIAKVLAYHKQYLSDAELREGYDYVLKTVEQGQKNWCDNLGEDLHEFLDYRANVIARAKLHESRSTITKQQDEVFNQKMEKIGNDNKKAEPEALGNKKPVFCMEYNQNKCEHSSSHEGSFGGRKVIKWHICRRCRRFNEIVHHPESDPECPRRA